MQIREADHNDLSGLLSLYTQYHYSQMPKIDSRIQAIWKQIMNDPNQHIVAGVLDGKIVSTCVLVVVPNLTHSQRPYAIIENVITDENYRKQGYASAVLNFAKQIAMKNGCYKIMLMTGSKLDSTLRFYEQSGYNRHDKTGFIQWLD